MADRLIRSETLTEIAEAIRIKTDGAEALSPGQMAERILKTGFGNIPAHHEAQATDFIQRIRALREAGGNYLVFGVMGDSHVNVGGEQEALSKTSARHAAYALETVGQWAGCDFLVNLGDNCWSGAADTAGAAYLNGCITAAFDRIPGYRLVGECDCAADPETVYALNGAHNVFGVTAATPRRGYGYTDHAQQRVRLIVLNTSDCCGSGVGYGMSYEQKDFLINALDLSGKADCDQWQILILSHYPLDHADDVHYNTAAEVKAILNAYVNGRPLLISIDSSYAAAENEDPRTCAAYSSSALTYNYSGKNGAKLIGNFHGHIHNASYGTMDGHQILRVCSPNACFYLESGSDGIYTVDAAQPKTENSAADTAVTFYAVDLDSYTIHSLAWGAGADRTISYS